MRAWLLLLAVLATFLTIVQVASTEDNNISVRFITAITPVEQTAKTSTSASSATTTMTTTTSAIKQHSTANTISTAILPTTSKTNTTALATAFRPIHELATVMSAVETTKTTASTTVSTSSSSSSSSSKLGNKRSDKSDKRTDRDSVKLIEMKNIHSSESHINNEVNKVYERTEIATHADQSEVFSNRKHKKVKTGDFIKHKKMAVKGNESAISDQHLHPHYKRHHQRHHRKEYETQQNDHPNHDQHNQQQNQHQHQLQLQHQLQPFLTEQPEQQLGPQPEPEQDPADYQIDSHSAAIGDTETSSTEILASVEVPANAEAVIIEDEPATYINKEIIKEKIKPDPSTLVVWENSLMSMFNMKRPPKIDRSKIIIPEAMKQLYAQMTGHELDPVNIPKPELLTKSANTVRSFTHKDSKIDDRFPHHHRFRLHFDVKSIPGNEKLKAAELQLSRDAISHAMLNPRQASRTRYQVLVYDITRIGVRGKREPNYLLLDSKTIRLDSTELVTMDVQPAVDRWLGTPQKNYGLLVEVRTLRSLKPAPHHHVRLRRSVHEPHEKWQHKQPLLFTYTDDGRPRSKRAGSHHRRPVRRKNTDEICRRIPLYVDFAEVGWSDWIVAPPGYDAFQCQGSCKFPLSDHLNSTNHAVVQTLVNNINPGKVPKASCVPTELEGISMLYLNDQNTVVLKNYQDMTVIGCGCR